MAQVGSGGGDAAIIPEFATVRKNPKLSSVLCVLQRYAPPKLEALTPDTWWSSSRQPGQRYARFEQATPITAGLFLGLFPDLVR